MKRIQAANSVFGEIFDYLPLQPKTLSHTGNSVQLVTHFHSTITNLLCFSPEATDESLASYVLPLVSNSELVYTAVEALSAAHLSNRGLAHPSVARRLHASTLNILAVSLGNVDFAKDVEVILATIVLLIYYEIVLGSSLSSAYTHLKGAKVVLQNFCGTQLSPDALFFVGILQYFDVIVAFSLHQRSLGFASGLLNADSVASEVDAVYGLTKSLWPKLEYLAKLRASEMLHSASHDQLEECEESLIQWNVEEPTSQIPRQTQIEREAVLQIARLHKYSALTILYSDFEDAFSIIIGPSRLQERRAAAYEKALESLLRVCVLSTTVSTVLWPLYVVSMQARSTSDQVLLENVFSSVMERQSMKVVSTARDAILQRWGGAYKGPLPLLG
ncbi:hypothetical protein PV08_03718 [Exophiala spinifera]|uniref:Uncharacterized protein n=1 Tax=Exophiala spinifera TaxID=91928 RepID=A0A0D2BKG9_9EURO|nr:uncharacterized protein PV08_03718 [Exophiala spinifera]KIW19423.1 hypothetical protein PV08_03718 [Exophiala spinifera]